MRKFAQPFIFLSHFFNVWGFLFLRKVSDKCQFLKLLSCLWNRVKDVPNFTHWATGLWAPCEHRCEEPASVHLWHSCQLRPECTFSTKCLLVSSFASPLSEDGLSGVAVQCCITLSLSPAGEVAQVLNHKMIFSPLPSPWTGYPAWRDAVVSVKHAAATHVGSARVNFKLASTGHW